MNFFTSALSTLTGSSIPYTIKEKIVNDSKSGTSNSIWTLYNGINPKDTSQVTIFQCNLKDPANIQRNYDKLARNAFKKAKLIKFPGIISIIDFIENDQYLYIISEPVVPALQYLSKHQLTQDSKVFGIHNLAQTLSFINSKCNCLHGNLNLTNSIYINQLGEWKLFGFELLTNLNSDPDQPIYRLNSYLPGSDILPKDLDLVRSSPLKLDSYLLATTISNVFGNNDFLNYKSILLSTTNIPRPLVNSVKKLANQSINLRITVEKFVQDTEQIFNSNEIVTFNHQLDEIKFKNNQEKLNFFKYELNALTSENEDKFPPGLLENKLLPELINQYSNLLKFKPTVNTTPEDVAHNQETISILLNFIIQFGVNLPQAKFNSSIKPIILESFSANDRSIRLILLNHLPKFESFLNESDIQSKLFYNVVNGFQDTNFMIRETTLKSITIIIDKISTKQINQDLLRILAKSQMDPKPSIRVNTLILIIKISSKIYKNSKNNVLITALAKSLKDTFIPCKMTALAGFESLRDDFSLEEICSKILGHLAISLMDPKSSKVRVEAKRVFQLYLDAVETHAQGLKDVIIDEDEEEAAFYKKYAPSQPVADEASTSTSTSEGGYGFAWGMVNKLVSAPAAKGVMNHDFNTSTPDLTRVSTPTTEPLETQSNTWRDFDENDGEGWDSDDNEEDDKTQIEIVPISKLSLNSKPKVLTTKGLNLSNKPAANSNLSKSINLTNTRSSGLKLGAKPVVKPVIKSVVKPTLVKAAPTQGSNPKLDLTKLVQEEDDDDGGWGGDDW